jgi:hypothetical protein
MQADSVREQFKGFLEGAKLSEKNRNLQDALWAFMFTAMHEVGANYELWLQAVALIVADWSQDQEEYWMRNPSHTGFERIVISKLEGEHGWGCLEREAFLCAVYHAQEERLKFLFGISIPYPIA